MKNGLLTAGILAVGLVVFAGTLTVAGEALRQPPRDIVLAVRAAAETTAQIQFPYKMAEMDLTVERLAVYEGPMIEQESDEPSANVLSLILCNGDDREIRSVQVTLKSSDSIYRFEGTHIPGQNRVLLMEQNGAFWKNETYTACNAVVEYMEETGLSQEEIAVTEVGMGELSVTNLTENCLRNVRIFHKNCLADGDICIGGITYETPVGELKPGQTVIITPERYASGYSKVVRIESAQEE